MRLIYLINGAYPHGMAMSKRLHCYAKSLVEKPLEQLVIATDSGLNNYSGYGEYDGVKYYCIKTVFRNYKNPLIALIRTELNYFLLLSALIRRARTHDICFFAGHSWVFLLNLRLVTYLMRIKLIIEVNELPYSFQKDRRLNNAFLSKLSQSIILKYVFPLVNGFIVISWELEKLIETTKNKNARIIRIPILINFINDPQSNNIFERGNNSYLFHAGTLNEEKDGIIAVFKAYALIAKRHHDFKFILTNRTTISGTISKIERIIDENGLADRVIFLNHVSNDEVINHLRKCTAAIINKLDNLQNKYNFSTKLGEYLAYGVPLITTSNGEATQYLRDGDNCFIIKANDFMSMADRLENILQYPEEVIKMSNNAMNTAYANFHFSQYSTKLFDFFSGLN